MKYGNWIKRILTSLLALLSVAYFSDATSYSRLHTSNHSPALHYATPYLSLDAQYSQLLGYVIGGKFTQKMNGSALAFELDYGKNKNRLNATWGFAMTPHQFFKITAERLSETLPFNFITGTMNQAIPQYGYGVAYEYIFPKGKINDINASIYYAHAQSQSLSPIIFILQGGEAIDHRHVAGATSAGMDLGFDAAPSNMTLIRLKLNYDQINYNAYYNLARTAKNDSSLGASANFIQLISKRIKLDLGASKRKIYDDYSIGLGWLSHLLNNRFETDFSIEHIVSHNSIPNDTNYTLSFKLNLDPTSAPLNYSLLSKQNKDLIAWTNMPAIHMATVLATTDEWIEEVDLSLYSVSPSVGEEEGELITVLGNGFVPGTTVTFGGIAATQVTFINHTTLTAIAPEHDNGAVDVTVTNPNNKSATLHGGYTYSEYYIPYITSINPNQGTTAGGTSVTLSGSHFTGTTSVTFGGSAATSVVIVNDTTITCGTPAHSAGAVNIVVTNPAGSGTLTSGYTYLASPAPTSVSPNQGITTGSTAVTISGSGFISTTGVTFGGSAATSVVVVNDTTITCVTPAHAAGSVDVVVTNAVSSGTLTNGYTYLAAPNPTSVNPNQGITTGSTSVTISGSGFTSTTGVTFGGSAATSVVVVNDTTITCVTPAHAAGSVDVVVTNAVASGTLTNGYTYLAAPNPTSVNPNQGITTGSTAVTISGSGFISTTGVTFGGSAATSVVVVNDTTITCVTPAHAAGAVDVVVTNAVSSGTLTNGYTYLAAPNPTSVNPNQGITTGSTAVTISGSGFISTTGVTFGGSAATSVVVVNDTTITCVTPAHAAGSVDVVVTNAVASGTLTNGFAYLATPAPTSANPNQGIDTGGTSVTISGSGLTGTTSVTFGGSAATSVVVVNDTTITCVTPAHAAGAVNVVVTNPVGSGTLTNGFTYYATPAPTSVLPNTGLSVGLLPVTISGSGFTGATTVTFGGAAATLVIVVNDTTITCVTPAHSLGAVNVVVSNPVASGTLVNGFTYTLI